ncbi:SURF1 family protein [Arthrobacter sp. Br18]|uniref:SURF1 family cytochrome oxidase biogenesis protein n=1 Tax=Arthrobacter sp. Br18 TaxID=1312954 RepID=UPI00047BCB3D|nr:SURF1 family protein [Arthrobacter sp. Br18]
MYRFLLSPRWLGWLLLVVLLAAACVGLGNWQMERRELAVAEIERIVANYEGTPVPYSAGTSSFASYSADREWTPVVLKGEYDTANQVIVRNRPLNGQPGYEVLTPLRLDDGTAVIINRGWLPIGNDRAGRPDAVPAPSDGDVTVIARVRPGEPAVDRGAPDGQIASIDLPGYAERLDYPVQTDAYGLMASESPAAAVAPVQFPKPSVNEGPHLSYSMQWFAFGVLLFVGLGYAARQQRRLNAEEDRNAGEADPAENAVFGRDPAGPYPSGHDGPRAGADPRISRRAARRRPTSEEEEDAILDARGIS